MKVMVIVKASPDSEAGKMPSQELMTEMGKFNEELAKAGILLAAEGLHPSSAGVRVAFGSKERTVTDGPFAETKELIAGFWLWKVKSMQEAIDWVKRCPNPHDEPGVIEIRPVFSPEDYGPQLTSEQQEREANVVAQVLGLGAVRFETARPFTVAGISSTYNGDSRKNIPAQWARFALHIGKVPGQIGTTSYGVCWNAEKNGTIDYLSGVEVGAAAELPPDFTRIGLPGGRYAVVTHEGHISTFPQTLDKVWGQWLPESPLKIAEAPWYERYTEKYDPRSGNGAVEIWLPLQT